MKNNERTKKYTKKNTKKSRNRSNRSNKTKKGGFISYLNPFYTTDATEVSNKTLPENWHEYKNLKGEPFYWNSLTNRFQSEFPDTSISNTEATGYKVLNENKMDSIPVTNCSCSKGIGVNRRDYPVKIDDSGNIYMESNKEFITGSKECNPGDCNINQIELENKETECNSWTEPFVSSIISTRHPKTSDGNPIRNELDISYTNGVKMGKRSCNEIKQELKQKLALAIPYKNCAVFKTINTINIKKHDLQKRHLSAISLIFKLFQNIKTVRIEMDPSITLSNDEIECLQSKYGFHMEYNNDKKMVIATR